MKSLLKYILQLFAFWMILLAMQRGLFLWYNNAELILCSASEIAKAFLVALRMDAATTGFLIILPLLFMIIALFVQRRIFPRLANIITVLLILIVICLGLIDMGLYSNWGSRINSKALFYVMFPEEGMRAVGAVPVWLLLGILIIQFALFTWIYLRFLRAKPLASGKKIISIIVAVLLLASLPVLFRGGFQKYPLGKNDVYYSRYPVLNYAALNSPWNFMYIVSSSQRQKNPYQYFKKEEAQKQCMELKTLSCDSTTIILTTPRPNIILIMMESCSAENMQRLGGKESVMPGLDSLCNEGLLFTRAYASGFRTEPRADCLAE